MSTLSGPMLVPADGAAPDAAVVLLHGYGSDGNDLIALAPHWRAVLPGALFISPHAPEPAMMAGAGRQWFAIDWAGDRLASRQTGVVGARQVIVDFLEAMWSQTGLGPERTILAGFSQGAMMALHAGLSLPASQTLMGVIGFSGDFLPPAGFGGPELARPPVCLVHGDADDVVAVDHSIQAEKVLREAGIAVELLVEPGMGHGIAPEGLDFATRFIARHSRK